MLKATIPFTALNNHTATHDHATGNSWWEALQESVHHFMTALAGSQEPHVSKIQHRDGHITWAVSDPMTGYRNTFATEQDVRVWLEQRYYQ
jgi:hypothetical protein